MKNTKTELRFFSITQYKKEEKYLREQHKKGWEFIKVDGLCMYHFQKCEPQDMIYQLDYNPDSTLQKSEYIQMFKDCGWKYLQNYVGYSYFCKAASEMNTTEEEIFCDDASRLDMMKRIFKGRMIPLLIIFFLIIIPQIIQQSLNSTHFSYSLMVFLYIIFIFYLVIFFSFSISFWRYYKSIHRK